MVIRRGLITILFVFLLASCAGMTEKSLERKIERVENGLLAEQSDPPWQGMNLIDRMAYYKVPGVSIAVINNFQIEWAKAYGVVEAGKDQPVTTETLFQPGSTAKPITAMAALHYVEAGALGLDNDVNNQLVSWKIPENDYTAQAAVTLRRLLSHSAGVVEVPLIGYAQGLAIPNRQQIMDGEPPANSQPVRVEAVPGSQFFYSNGGYLIVEQLLVDVVGMPFDVMMQKTVLDPLDMDASTFQSPIPENLAPIAASGHLADGRVIPGKWHNFPELGTGGGMWTTASDLARFYIDLMLTYTGESEKIISHEMAVEMLTPLLDSRGLGPWIGDDGGDLFYFLHPGATDGYKSYIVGYPKKGQGIVILTNSDASDALFDEIVNSMTQEYGWARNYTLLATGVVVILMIGLVVFLIWRRKRSGRTLA